MAHLLENEDDDDFYKQKYGEEIFRDSNSEFDEDECEHASKAVLVCSDESMIVLMFNTIHCLSQTFCIINSLRCLIN